MAPSLARRGQQMVKPNLEVHYSVPDLFGRTLFCAGVALVAAMVGEEMAPQNSWIIVCYVVAAVSVGIGLTSLYRLLNAKGEVVISIDATGFKDTRLTPTVVPWRAIRSVWGYHPRGAQKANGIVLSIDSAFKRGISIRLGANLWRWINFSFGSVFYVDVGTLDVNADEIVLAAQQYLPKRG
jgi:hypothetical protein